MKNYIWATLFWVALVSCSDNAYFDEVRDFESKSWIRADTLNFQVDIQNPADTFDVFVTLRNTYDYPFQRLYLKYAIIGAEGDSLLSRMSEYELFNDAGEPLGGGLGDIYDHQLLLIEDLKLAEPGTYQFSLMHYMRPDTLNAVISAGLRLEYNQDAKYD